MKRYRYEEPITVDGEIESLIITVSEEYIRTVYWPFWWKRMAKVNRIHLATFERCVEDFIAIRWGEEI